MVFMITNSHAKGNPHDNFDDNQDHNATPQDTQGNLDENQEQEKHAAAINKTG